MGFLETLTMVFVVLKLLDVIAWSWWIVFSPMIVGYLIIFFFVVLVAVLKGLDSK